MIRKEQILSLEYYRYGGTFTGSFSGMRYRVERIGEEEEYKFFVHAWEEPYNYETTEKDKMKEIEFPFSEEGAQQVVDWLNGLHENGEYKVS